MADRTAVREDFPVQPTIRPRVGLSRPRPEPGGPIAEAGKGPIPVRVRYLRPCAAFSCGRRLSGREMSSGWLCS
eukprot:scaffold803_cov310-Pinguiococcus_pyrenoidosus.AAC.141